MVGAFLFVEKLNATLEQIETSKLSAFKRLCLPSVIIMGLDLHLLPLAVNYCSLQEVFKL